MPTVIYDHRIFSHQEFGGVSRYFCELAQRIGRRPPWAARVVAPLHYNRYLSESRVSTLGLYVPLPHRKFARLYAAFDDALSPPLIGLMRKDIVHRTYYGGRAQRSQTPFVLTVFDMIHERFPAYFPPHDPILALKRTLVESADHIVCISHQTADDLVQLLGVSPAKISTTHLAFSSVFGSQPSAAPALQIPSQRPYLLYVGKRGGYKNFGRVVAAFAGSQEIRRRYDLVAFGGGPFDAREIADFSALRLDSGAVRYEAGDDAALARCYAGAAAFVYPSEYEGFGIPPLEAMACGCAVICSNTSSIPEVVGEAGEYFDPLDVDSIRLALERVLLDDTRRGALVAAGRARCRQFSWDRCAEETLAVYEKVLAAR